MRRVSKSRVAKSSKIVDFKSMLEPADTGPAQPSPNVALRGRRERPESMEEAAFHGLVGEFLDIVLPETESDASALVSQLLVAYGNVIGRRAHFDVEDDRHYLKLFVVLVGRTSQGRKGVSWTPSQAKIRGYGSGLV